MKFRALCDGSLSLAVRPARLNCQHQVMRRSLCSSSRLQVAVPTTPRLRLSIPGAPLRRIQDGPFTGTSSRGGSKSVLLLRRPLFYTVRNQQGQSEQDGKYVLFEPSTTFICHYGRHVMGLTWLNLGHPLHRVRNRHRQLHLHLEVFARSYPSRYRP